MTDNEKQPAFPISEEETDRIDSGVKIYTGLTKREYFAGLAMQGYLSIHSNKGSHNRIGGPEFDANMAAKCAVAYADALLAELAKTEKP